jgi:hypothetical protein
MPRKPIWFNRPAKTLSRKDPLCILWVAENRNTLTEIADLCDCSPQFVSLVLHQRRKSKDGRVERALRDRGAPLVTKV